MNILSFLLKDIRNIAIIILILFAGFFIFKSNSLTKKLNESQMDYYNQVAITDSVRTIAENTYQKLGLITTEKELKEIANTELEDKLNGKITEINQLNIKVSNLSGTINDLQANTKIDTIIIGNTVYSAFSYPYNKTNKDYDINGNINVISKTEPYKVNVNYNITFNPINLSIITSKNNDFSYSITVKTSTNLIKFTNMNAYIPPPELELNKPFYKKFDIGIGAGIDNSGIGYLLGGIKYSKNIFNVTYSGNNGNYGIQYQRFLWNN